MIGEIGAHKRRMSRKQLAVFAFCLVVVNAAFLIFAVSGVIDHIVAFGISITCVLCALALIVMIAKSRCGD